MSRDPVDSNPDHYRVVLENAHVRVLRYDDRPGDRTTDHEHPDSVMITLSAFRRRLRSSAGDRDVELPAGAALWLPAQTHRGENIGSTPTEVLFVEVKTPPVEGTSGSALGPA